MRGILLFLSFWITATVMAQTVTIKKVELSGENVIVTYDLEDSNPNNEYLLNLYSSRDNYNAPLVSVTGDVGMEIKPGADKKITWNILKEYGNYKGKLALEIRGKVYVPFVRLQNFDAAKSYKKGKSYPVTWKVGGSNPINIELYKGGQRISGDINQPNNGVHTLFIPKHAVPGKDYRLKISDARNSEEVIYTPYFKIAPGIPMWAKAAGGAVVVGVIVFIATSGGDPDPGDDPVEVEIDKPNVPN
jgi:hypothetical protein